MQNRVKTKTFGFPHLPPELSLGLPVVLFLFSECGGFAQGKGVGLPGLEWIRANRHRDSHPEAQGTHHGGSGFRPDSRPPSQHESNHGHPCGVPCGVVRAGRKCALAVGQWAAGVLALGQGGSPCHDDRRKPWGRPAALPGKNAAEYWLSVEMSVWGLGQAGLQFAAMLSWKKRASLGEGQTGAAAQLCTSPWRVLESPANEGRFPLLWTHVHRSQLSRPCLFTGFFCPPELHTSESGATVGTDMG